MDGEKLEPAKPKVVQLPEQQDKTKATLDAMERQMPELIRSAKVIAQIRRANFEAYIEQGFTEAQALELCKH